MKKYLSVTMAVVIMLSFAACSSNQNNEETTTELTTKKEETTTHQVVTAEEVQGAVQNGGISNKSTFEEIANYYNEVLLNSKETNSVKGSDNINIIDYDINFASKSAVKKAADKAVEKFFIKSTDKPLPVYGSKKIKLQPDDIKSFDVVDNGDTYILTIVPKDEINPPATNCGPQSRFFDILVGIEEQIKQIKQFEYEGNLNDHIILTYTGGNGIIVVDKLTKQIVSASYNCLVNIEVKDIKLIFDIDKATAKVSYATNYN